MADRIAHRSCAICIAHALHACPGHQVADVVVVAIRVAETTDAGVAGGIADLSGGTAAAEALRPADETGGVTYATGTAMLVRQAVDTRAGDRLTPASEAAGTPRRPLDSVCAQRPRAAPELPLSTSWVPVC